MVTKNNVEIEAKIAVDDLDAMEARLRELGAVRKGEYTETDTFFDFPDKRLKTADSALRLRERRDLATHKSNYRLTYKGPRQKGPFKHRAEIEFSVDQPENVQAMLEVLGFHAIISYTKRRNSWSFDRCDIEVDEIEGIGKFIEVEGPDEACIRQVLASLAVEDRPVIQERYLSRVIKKHCGI